MFGAMKDGTLQVEVICASAGSAGQEGVLSAYGIGRSTYEFVRRAMRDPEIREKIRARAEELRSAK